MSWSAITEADVLTVLAGKELSAYRTAALASGQADPVAPVITQVTDLVRGYVAGCANNELTDGDVVPDKLKAMALDIIAVRIPQRVGKDPKQVRKDAATQAFKILEQVAACRISILDVSASGTPSIAKPTRPWSRVNQDGI